MIWIALVFLLVSLLTITKPPFYQAWLLSVAVAGVPWLFALLSIAMLLEGILRLYTGGFQAATVGEIVFSAAASVLFCCPILRAFSQADSLLNELEKVPFLQNTAFPLPTAQPSRPFRFWKMFTGPLEKKVAFRKIPYCETDDYSLELDFYPAEIAGYRPCVVVIHGGSWSSGNSRQLPQLNSRLARSGFHVAAINYRLAPRYRSPLAIADLRSAITYLRKRAESLRIAADELVLLGRSAGGQIALQAAYTFNEPSIRGVIAYYAPADMVWGYHAPASRLVMDSCKVMEDYLGGSYQEVPERYHAASPVEAAAGWRVPTLLLHGRNDVLVSYEHSQRLVKQLRLHRTPHYLLTLPAGTHGFDYVLNGPEGQLATYVVQCFLNRVIPASRPGR